MHGNKDNREYCARLGPVDGGQGSIIWFYVYGIGMTGVLSVNFLPPTHKYMFMGQQLYEYIRTMVRAVIFSSSICGYSEQNLLANYIGCRGRWGTANWGMG